MSLLSKPHMFDEAKAFDYVEAMLWPNGPVCPHCGNKDRIYRLEGVRSKPSKKNPEGLERFGLKKCGACRKQFTVRKGTIFEESHIPLHKWLQALALMASSKKGISANQLHRTLEITLKSAWFLAHRIREAMRSGSFDPMGGAGEIVEADETFIGREPGKPKRRAYHHKMKLLALVDRNSGQSRTMVVDDLRAATLTPILRANIAREAHVMTDEAGQYRKLASDFAAHDYVRHGQGEYGRGDIHTNTIEGFFSVFKRGMKGVYQHAAKKHLHRYAAEFEFRYNNRVALGVHDGERAVRALSGAVGKRLLYRDSFAA